MKKANFNAKLIIFLSWAAYTAAYVGRLNFNAYIEPIREQLGASKSELGIVSSFFFFAYGAGQLIHGILSKKYNTRYSVAVALVGSAAVNAGMAFCSSTSLMKPLWLLNGVFQSILWSSVIKTLSERLSDEMLPKAIVAMSTPPALGTLLIYGSAALMAANGVSMKWMFILPASILAAAGVAWFSLIGKSKAIFDGEIVQPNQKMKITPAFVLSVVMIFCAAVSNGFIKDGVTTWTPSILKENYGMQDSMSILVTLLLPLIAIAGASISTALHKKINDSFKLNALLYGVETIVLAGALLVSKGNVGRPAALVALFAVSAMLMSAVNNVITSIVPMYMRKSMNSGLLAGVLDTFCYVGSTLATGVLGYISEKSSWNGVFLCLLIFSAAAFAVCAAQSVLNGKGKEKSDE